MSDWRELYATKIKIHQIKIEFEDKLLELRQNCNKS